MSERAARIAHVLTAGSASGGVALSLATSVHDWGRSASAVGRLVDELSYFTVQSNIVVALTTVALAVGWGGRSSVLRVLRLAGVGAIALTGLVYHTVLAGGTAPAGADLVADLLLHTVSPLLCLAGWLLFESRHPPSWRDAVASLAFPLWWTAYTLTRGELVVDRDGHPWYPYGIVDVGAAGYGSVARNLVVLWLVLAALTAASWWGGTRLPALRRRA